MGMEIFSIEIGGWMMDSQNSLSKRSCLLPKTGYLLSKSDGLLSNPSFNEASLELITFGPPSAILTVRVQHIIPFQASTLCNTIVIEEACRDTRMEVKKMDVAQVKIYLKDPSKAILDAKNHEFTQFEMQDGLDALYNQLKLKQKGPFSGIGSLLTNIYQWDALKLITSQDYLDSRINPFIEKMNAELQWTLKQYDDFMD
ncbi:hypothetical protein [Ectobacillus sp. sgz5001026]|uniref:hypothetical protein n=1 Tax=Ectobacillus sp. sgz5001026 TaxID=3242473 RepID=UPI0036D2288D